MSFLDKLFRRKAEDAGAFDETFVYGEESLKATGGVRRVRTRAAGEFGTSKGFSTSVSLADLGLVMEDLAKPGRGGSASAAPRKAGGGGYQIPEGMEEDEADSRPESERIKGLQVQRGGGQQNIQPPTIESIQIRQQRALTALRYFNTDSIAGAAIRTLYEFVIGPGFTVEFDYNYEVVPPWFNTEAPEVAPVKAKFAQEQAELGETTGGPGKKSNSRDLQIFKAYMQWRAEQLKEALNLEYKATEMARDALVLGDAFCYRVDSITDEAAWEDYEPKLEYLMNDIVDVQGLNPLAIMLEVDEFNELTRALIVPQSTGGAGGGSQPINIPDLEKLIRLKWNGSSYSIYGMSHLTPALTELTLKESLLRAAKASADRFAIPLRVAKYGLEVSGTVSGPIATTAMRDELADALEALVPETETLVVPFHNTIELIGAENGVIDLSGEISESDRRIMMALGIPPNFLDSNFTSFATAKIQFTNTILKLRQLQSQTARALEKGIFEPWAKMRGYRNIDGSVIDFEVKWHRGELESDPAIIALIGILAGQVGQTILSRRTMRATLGFSNDLEEQYIATEQAQDSQRAAELGLPQPGQVQIGPDGKPLPTGTGIDPNDPFAPKPLPGEEGKPETQNPARLSKKPTVVKGPAQKTNTNPTKVNK
jgi:hypothetical protein